MVTESMWCIREVLLFLWRENLALEIFGSCKIWINLISVSEVFLSLANKGLKKYMWHWYKRGHPCEWVVVWNNGRKKNRGNDHFFTKNKIY